MPELHPQLQQDCVVLGRFPLCHLLLMRDANYPWFILVPDRDDVVEIYQLSQDDQKYLMKESSYLAEALANRFQADKINIAALGNMVSQLHIHHIVRYKNDAAWPAPIWGKIAPAPYTDEVLAVLVANLKEVLTEEFEFLV